jgi:hypothetical protein
VWLSRGRGFSKLIGAVAATLDEEALDDLPELPDAAHAPAVDRDELAACTRAALTCQLACIACAEEFLRKADARSLDVVWACLGCLGACIELAHAAETPHDTALVRASLESCVRASAKCEREVRSGGASTLEKYLEMCAKFREQCRALLRGEPRPPLDRAPSSR